MTSEKTKDFFLIEYGPYVTSGSIQGPVPSMSEVQIQGGTCFAFSPIYPSLLTDKTKIIFPFLGICLQIKWFLPD